jgi:hypothetical protein
MSKFQKIRNNLLSGNAVAALGPAQYTRYLASFLASVPSIRRAGDLRPVDKIMGRTARQFHYRGKPFFFDCRFCDQHLQEDSFGFGIARELYIRDCYFRWHPAAVYDRARTVVDLGANRGAFSALMTTTATFILSVECQKQYVPTIQHNMRLNNFTRYAVETTFVGAGGAVAGSSSPRVTMEELLQRHGIQSVDLLKVDIEGSEFALFAGADWLRRVNAISLEIHPHHGDPDKLLRTFTHHGFKHTAVDENLQTVTDTKRANFIYAWKNV